MPRWAKIALGIFGGIIALLLVGVLVLTQTDFGRARVRNLVLDQLRNQVHGEVSIGELSGNLLSGATIDSVVINDSTGAPFLRADRVRVGYSLPALLSQRILLTELTLVDPVIVLNKPPGEEWNFARIFPSDTTQQDTTTGGFGSWVRIEDLAVRGGRLLVRNTWEPDSTLTGAARDSAVAEALSGEGLLRVVRVPGGYQTIQDFQQLSAKLPVLRLAHPDSADIRAEIASLQTLAYIGARPAVIRNLQGTVLSGEDSIRFPALQLRLPESQLAIEGAYAKESGGLRAAIRAAPIRLADLQWIRPTLPDSGGGTLQLAVLRTEQRTSIVARDIDLRIQGAELAGHLQAQFGDSLQLGDTDLRFAGIETRLIRELAPDAEIPVDGTASGRIALSGSPDALDVDGRIAFVRAGGDTTQVFANGVVGTADEGFSARQLRLRFAPVQLALIESFRPDLRVRGVLTGEATLTGSMGEGFQVDADLAHRGPGTGRSHLLADGRVAFADGFSARDFTVRLDPLQIELARAFAPQLPPGGSLAGRIRLDGDPQRLRVDADVTHRDARLGRSRLLANGFVSTANGFAAQDLALRFDPLQVALVESFAPDLPVGGTVSGRATVTGSADTRFAASLDLVHRAPTGVTHLIGNTRVILAEPRRFYVDLRAPALSLNTVGRFAPAAQLRGAGSGSLRAQGTLDDLRLALDLQTESGGGIDLQGQFDLQGEPKRYDLLARFNQFNAGALSARAPETALTGTVSAEGQGTDPATLNAVIAADLTGTGVQVPADNGEGADVDAARVRLRLADGLATFERGQIQLASAQADVQGSFGLVAGRSGTLRYRIAVDSLSQFAAYLPAADSTAAAADSATTRLAGALLGVPTDSATQVAVGEAARNAATTDTAAAVAALPPDSLSGSIRAEGIVAGNIERFDLRGTAALEDVVARGNAVGTGRLDYSLLGFGTDRSTVALNAALGSVRAGGFALDSLTTRIGYAGNPDEGQGSAQVTVYQNTRRDFRFRTDYRLALDEKEVRFDDVLLRFDTTRWESTRPGLVRWGGRGVEIDSLSLQSGDGGRIFVDGTLPTEGAANLAVDIRGLQIGQVLGVVQDTAQLSGVLSLQATLDGTARAPRLRGEMALADPAYGGTEIPAIRAAFEYADTELRTRARLLRQGAPLLVADARLPVNLALSGYDGPRLLDTRPLLVDVRADSLPVDALSEFSDAVANARGSASGTVAVRGTWDTPDVDGRLALNDAALDLVTPGLELRDVRGLLRFTRDRVFLDSLVAISDGGPIRAEGTLDITTPSAPGFDLTLDARDALVLDNEQGAIRANADLQMKGPYDRVAVTGDARVLEGTLYFPSDGQDVIALDERMVQPIIDSLQVAPGVVPEPNPLLQNLRVDVGVRISRNTWIRNTDANVEIYTPDGADPLRIQMDRQSEALTVEGVVNADRGEYSVAGRLFDLTSGTVTFLGGPTIDPLLQLTAVYEVPQPNRENLAIQVHIGGNLSDLSFTLDSDAQPPLSQSDLLGYLVFGKSSSSLLQQGGSGLNNGGEGGSGGLTALATQKLPALAIGAVVDGIVTDLEQQADRSGLDVFRVYPADDLPEEAALGGNFGNALRGTQIEAGKYFNQRLFVAAKGRPDGTLPGLRVEYRTPAGFRWMTTWEPRYQPRDPSFSLDDPVESARVFGLFLLWERRF